MKLPTLEVGGVGGREYTTYTLPYSLPLIGVDS